MYKNKNIYLIGMMGAGKSTVGKELARQLKIGFIDVDTVIENEAQMSIGEIFDQYGEEKFRFLEQQALFEISKRGGYVVATGGGVILREQNRQRMLATGIRIFLEVDMEVIERRLESSYHRPLAKSPDQLQSIYQQRYSWYCECEKRVKADKNVAEVTQQILSYLFAL